jgi:hypothetical protein
MAKRAHGEGSIRQRPNGTWEARLSYPDPATGQMKSVSLYAPTAELVRDKLDEARDRIKAEAPVRDSSQRLSEWLTHWYDTALEASSRKQSTKALYRTLATKHLSPGPLGTTALDKLRKTHIDALIVRLRKQGLSDSTVRQVYTVLRAALDDAVLDGLMARNPCTLVKAPSRTQTRSQASRRGDGCRGPERRGGSALLPGTRVDRRHGFAPRGSSRSALEARELQRRLTQSGGHAQPGWQRAGGYGTQE